MKTFKEIFESVVLQERILNLFAKDEEEREKYADEVWNILQTSYQKIGGLRGSGFGSKQEMIDKIPFWKIFKRNGRVVAVMMYKDKGGRKRVAMGADLPDGKEYVAMEIKHEFGRAYFEVSGPSYGFIKKAVGVDFMRKYAKTPEEVNDIVKDEEIISYNEWLAQGNPKSEDVKGGDPLMDYFYMREIGGKKKAKIMLGTRGNKIVTA